MFFLHLSVLLQFRTYGRHIGTDNRSVLVLLFLHGLFLRFLHQQVGEQVCGEAGLVLRHILRHPHPLPLLPAHFTGLHLVDAVYDGNTQYLVILAFEHVDTLDAQRIDALRHGTEQVNLQVGICLCEGIVFLCQLVTDSSRRHAVILLDGGEEAVDVVLVRAYAERRPVFRLEVQRPAARIVTEHLDPLEPHFRGAADSLADIEVRYFSDILSVQFSRIHLFVRKVGIVGMIAQLAVLVEEPDIRGTLRR